MKVQLHAPHDLLLGAIVLGGIHVQAVDDLDSLSWLLASATLDPAIIGGRCVKTVQHVITYPVVHYAIFPTAAMCAIDVPLVKA